MFVVKNGAFRFKWKVLKGKAEAFWGLTALQSECKAETNEPVFNAPPACFRKRSYLGGGGSYFLLMTG